MVTKYHRNIQKAVLEFGKKQTLVRKSLEGNSKPLPIVEPESKYVVNYQPDVYFILKNRKKVIFEILESEIHKQDIIIADVIRSCLVENVSLIVFIHPSTKEKDSERALEALYTVTKGIATKGIPAEELPKKGYVYLVTKNEALNQKQLFCKIQQLCKKDKWFK